MKYSARKIFVALLALPLLAGSALAETNPPADDFDLAGSDQQAIAIADAVMASMGGRDAWDATRHLRWRFFGRRLHVWDKQTGNIRVQGSESDSGAEYVILMNIHTKEGRAWRGGAEITAPDELEKMLDRGEAQWINDSYWMFMPYKLKDSGVTLRYVGEQALPDGRSADVLELTFRDVGRTPDNKYHVFVSQDRRFVEQWAFFDQAADDEPRFLTPWANWQRYGSILLSDGRGESSHTDLAVFATLPTSVYEDPSPVDWDNFE